MSSRILSSFLHVVSILIANAVNAQEFKSLEFNRWIPLHVFSDKANKISGYATGKYLTYNIPLLNNLGLTSVGIVFDYKDLSRIRSLVKPNVNQFGNAYTLIGTLNFSLVNYKELTLSFSPGFGLSYLDKTWYTDKNPIIRSHLNFASTASVKMSYELNEVTNVSSGLSILHFSNAAIRIPNNGMNIIGFSLGLARYFSVNKNKQLKLFAHKEPDFKKHNFELGVNIGRRGVYNSKKSLYKSGVYLGYGYMLNSLFAVSTGIDGVYYYSPFDPNRYIETYQSKATSFDEWCIGIGVGPSVNIGGLGFSALYGYYLHYRSFMPIYTYWNASIKVKLNGWVGCQAKLYAHQEEVDFLGLGLLFSFGAY